MNELTSAAIAAEDEELRVKSQQIRNARRRSS